MRLFVRLIALAAVAGCVRFQSPPPQPTVSSSSAWARVISAAHQDAATGRHDDAERVLRDFSAAYPGTAEAAESGYWRAVFLLDPANPRSSPRDALVLLGEYLDSEILQAHRPEALVLRRIAGTMTTTRDAAATRATTADARDAEIRRLKDELEKTTAELDRIKKRLSPPPANAPPPATPPPR